MNADRDQEPVLKLAGGLRRNILAVAKAALAARSAPQRAVRNKPTPATGKRPPARRVFGQKAVWLRCSVVAARSASSPRLIRFPEVFGPPPREPTKSPRSRWGIHLRREMIFQRVRSMAAATLLRDHRRSRLLS